MNYTKNSETKSPFSFAYKKVLRSFIEDILVLLFTTEISVAKKKINPLNQTAKSTGRLLLVRL